MTTGRRRGRPPRLSREEVAEAVLEVGFPDLTFAAVRQRLGVGETTLFRYAPDRDELVRLGLGRMVETARWPTLSGSWRDVLRACAHCLWRTCERHPGAAAEAARGLIPLSGVRLVDDLCIHLVECGFTAHGAVLACDMVFDLVIDSRRGAEGLDGLTGGGPRRRDLQEVWGALPEPEEGGDPVRRVVQETRRTMVQRPPIEWFDTKLEIILDGVAASLH
ncbi:TetR/AcrR family transcriptional regulator [Arachnia propionica]|uniref:TetR/AcrR family transcriptional regulator n=1 Tax=Arachnia propionica TaxID=1750 RepID=A0A3P1TBB7_9ACTN|nr:TetR/AcrR family transcriptional regulator [Arachnia propionica]MDO5082144.1 TetR/AcrR family transcriptional regulator [Arachnia propionica]RRD06689.1 TetR/AcrR family transcriptional regulator [Arachnia propionica]